MATNAVALKPSKMADILEETERLILEHNDDPFIMDGPERAMLNAFEDVLTRAIEDGTAIVVNQAVADLLHEQCVLDSADLVGGEWPLGPEAARWVKRNPEDCTQDFDGICRCSFDPEDH